MSDATVRGAASWDSETAVYWDGNSWEATQAKVWSGTAWVSVPPDTATTVFDVTAAPYSADDTGATDCGAAIEAAFLAAHANSAEGAHSTVYFPAGTYLVTNDEKWDIPAIRSNDWYGQTSPTVVRAGTVRLSGYGATIKYANATDRFCWLQYGGSDNTLTLYSTWGNLEIFGFTIDPNDRVPSAQCASIIYLSGEGNLDNITIKDVTVLNNMAPRTAWNTPNRNRGLLLCSRHDVRTQAHYTYCTNITVQDCTIYAQGKGIGIYAQSMGADTTYGTSKCLYDNIVIDGCWVSNNHHHGSCIHLGSYGAGYRCRVTNTHIEDSTDNGLEIDAFNDSYVENLTCDKLRAPVGVTRFSWPYLSSAPTYVFKNVQWSGTCTNAYWPTDMTTEPAIANPEIEVVELRSGLTARRFGHFFFERCGCAVADEYTHDNHWFYLHAPMDSVTIRDCDLTIAGSDSYDPVYVSQSSVAGITLPVSIYDVRWRNDPANSYALLTSSQVTLAGSRSVDSDIPGLA